MKNFSQAHGGNRDRHLGDRSERVDWSITWQRRLWDLWFWQHFMFPMWAIEQVEDWLMEDAWQRPQGVRATNNPKVRTIRFKMENNFFIP